ncbi:MAG: sigma-70 family RNA polymerase sigma factor [Clostridia bacterium]|nr:sigma-70 family RNA polymerase sigma factor [Clostridia bacterium]
MKRSAIRKDLNNLRKLCDSIRTIEYYHISSGEPMCGSPLAEELARLNAKRDRIYEKYRKSVNALSPEESIIFTLYYLEGNTQKQVAAKTNYCKSSITKHISAIISKLG